MLTTLGVILFGLVFLAGGVGWRLSDAIVRPGVEARDEAFGQSKATQEKNVTQARILLAVAGTSILIVGIITAIFHLTS